MARSVYGPGRRARRDDRRRSGGRGHLGQPGPIGNRLHEVPEGRRPEGRAHRRGARLLRRRRGRGLGDGGGARRDAPRRRDDRGRALSRSGCSTRRASLYNAVRWPEFAAADRDLPRHHRAAIPEDAGRDDRALEAVHLHPSRRRDAEPAALGPLQRAKPAAAPWTTPATRRSTITCCPRCGCWSKACSRRNKLDAIVYPTSSRRPGLIAGPGDPSGTPSATNIANLTGFPDLIVPAGFTSDKLPVGLSFFGPRSAKASCSASATASNRCRRRAAGRCTRQRCRARR